LQSFVSHLCGQSQGKLEMLPRLLRLSDTHEGEAKRIVRLYFRVSVLGGPCKLNCLQVVVNASLPVCMSEMHSCRGVQGFHFQSRVTMPLGQFKGAVERDPRVVQIKYFAAENMPVAGLQASFEQRSFGY